MHTCFYLYVLVVCCSDSPFDRLDLGLCVVVVLYLRFRVAAVTKMRV